MKRPKRKAISKGLKDRRRAAQGGLCVECGLPLGDDIRADHRPPLWQREVNADGTDYIPAQLDPDFIQILHPKCHDRLTFGRAIDAEKTVTILGSDVWVKKKFDRLEGRTKPRPKTRWPKRKLEGRPFPKRKHRVDK